MKKKPVRIILFTVLLLAGIAGCGGSGGDSSDTSDNASDSVSDDAVSSLDKALYAVSVAESVATYNSEDIVGNITFDYTVEIDFTENTAKLSTGEALAVTTDGAEVLAVDDTKVTVTKTAYGITASSTIAGNVRFNLTGELSGTFTVLSSSPYQLYLDGVSITGTAGPALDLESSQKVYLVTAAGTTSTLKDSSTRSMTMKAALYGKGPMVFGGDGVLSVTGSYKHGIFSNDYIRVTGGEIEVAVSTKDAVRSVNGFIFDDGVLSVNATGTTTDDESKGIKVEGSEDTGTGKGYIVINGGYMTITSVSKAVTASWDIDEDAETADTADDPAPFVVVNSGVITINTTGTPYEYVSGGVTVSCSPEGIEGKSGLTVNSGYLVIKTSDDALNTGGNLVINGGVMFCESSDNDAIDANGNLTINGGAIVAIGSSAPEGSIDCDNNTLAIKGGTFVGIGGNTSRPTAASCTQNVLVLGSMSKGSTLAIKAADGTTAFAFEIPAAYATMILSAPTLETGTKYTLYTGGTATGDDVFSGLFLGDLDYSGGTAGTSFTVSSRLTKLGGVYF